jgi:hypothetical protein
MVMNVFEVNNRWCRGGFTQDYRLYLIILLNPPLHNKNEKVYQDYRLYLIILLNPPLHNKNEKCDRLMSLCDTLEAKLKQGRDSSEKLMEVAAKQVLTA